MPKRSPARWVAPAALAAAAFAVYVVIAPVLGGDDAGSDGPRSAETTPDRTTPGRTTRSSSGSGSESRDGKATTPEARTYVVQPGDTLSSIATANGTTLEELERLNPDADSASLTVGQRLVLRAPKDR